MLPDKTIIVILCVTAISLALVIKEQYVFAVAGLTALAGLLVPVSGGSDASNSA
jgi:hypothetical protein